jgi:hypothetical protein
MYAILLSRDCLSIIYEIERNGNGKRVLSTTYTCPRLAKLHPMLRTQVTVLVRENYTRNEIRQIPVHQALLSPPTGMSPLPSLGLRRICFYFLSPLVTGQ